jgi:hypothetical protein
MLDLTLLPQQKAKTPLAGKTRLCYIRRRIETVDYGPNKMKHFLLVLSFALCLISLLEAAAQEQKKAEAFRGKMYGVNVRGKFLMKQTRENENGGYDEPTYRDGSGNPLSEREQNLINGYEKISLFGWSASVRAMTTGIGGPVRLLFQYGDNPDFLSAVGLTAEQIGKFNSALWNLPELPTDEMIAVWEQAGQTDDTEELALLGQKWENYANENTEKAFQYVSKAVSPEQMLRLRELELQMPSPFGTNDPYITFGAYEGLNLTDEQKNTLRLLKEEFLKEQEEYFQAEKSGSRRASEKIKNAIDAVTVKIKKMLNEEQTKKLAELLANRPQFLTDRTVLFRTAKKEDDSWKKSWKPGDPIPAGAVPPRPKGRFPLHE